MTEDALSTSLCESEFQRIGLKFWIGDDGEASLLDIHTAASVGDTEYISFLPPASYDKYNTSEWTPLMYACYLGHRQLFKFLIEKKCDISKRNKEGRTPLMLAGMCGNLDLVRDLMTCSGEARSMLDMVDTRNFSALSHAVHGGHADIARFLLGQGANPNLTEHEKGYSILMMSASTGNYNITELLIQYNSDLTYANALGETAFSVAQAAGQANIVQLLRNHKSSVSKLSSLSGPARAELLLQQRLLSPGPLYPSRGTSSPLHNTDLKSSNFSQLALEIDRLDSQPDMTIDIFLENLGLQKYIRIFREQEVDFELLLTLTDRDLKQIGITVLGPRRKIIAGIASWKDTHGKIIS